MDVIIYDYNLSRYNAIADPRGIGWKSIEEQMANLEPTDIPEEVQGLENMILLPSFKASPMTLRWGRESLYKDELS